MFSHVFQSFWPGFWWINGWVLVEIYQFWSNFDGKMGVSAGEMRVLVQFLDVFCGKMVVFDGETRILVQFWMENGWVLVENSIFWFSSDGTMVEKWEFWCSFGGNIQVLGEFWWKNECNLPTPPSVNWPPFSMLTKLIGITIVIICEKMSNKLN